MELELLNRLQFAITIFFHYIFVPLTIGLVALILFMELKYFFTKKPIYREMTEFWTKIFIVNAAIGVVTGISMEFQFGTNWSEYSTYMGDIFAGPLALEALLAFFLESIFITSNPQYKYNNSFQQVFCTDKLAFFFTKLQIRCPIEFGYIKPK